MLQIDKKIVEDLKEDIEDSVFTDEYGYLIDSLADLETDEDIIKKCLGGKKDGREN